MRINRATPITPTSLVTLALLGSRDRALTLDEIARRAEPLVDLRRAPRAADDRAARSALGCRPFAAPSTRSRESGVVTCFDRGPEAVYSSARTSTSTAAYYRNTIIHFFVDGAIAELALLRAAEAGASGDVVERGLLGRGDGLRDLLKFEFFFAEKETYRDEVAAELAARNPGWEDALASHHDARALAGRLEPLLAHVVLRPFMEGYRVVGDELEQQEPGKTQEESAFLNACLARAQQYVLQRRIGSRESVSQVLFQSALRLARNRGLIDAQASAGDLRARRAAFAGEIRAAIRRIDAIDAWAEGRRASVVD